MLQQEVEKILQGRGSKEEKIQALRSCFERHDIQFFVDLDGTLTKHSSVFYAKVRLLKLFKHPEKEYAALLAGFTINKKFLCVAKKKRIKTFVVLTRNYQDFLDYFMLATRDVFAKAGLEIVGGIGRSEEFYMQSRDKLAMLPEGALLISDLFEYNAFNDAEQFLCIERFSWVRYGFVTLGKVASFFGFLIRRYG